MLFFHTKPTDMGSFTAKMRRSCCALLLLVISLPVLADPRLPWQSSIAGEVVQFSYKEFMPSGEMKNREDGPLWGVAANFYYPYGRWSAGLELGARFNRVKYYGQTNGGNEWVTSQTYEEFLSASLSGGYRLWDGESSHGELYLAAGVSRWDRNIQSAYLSDGVTLATGLYEVYTWFPINLGMRFFSSERGVGGAFQVGYISQPNMLYHNAPGDFYFFMEEKGSLRVSLYKMVALLGADIVVEPFYEMWEFGQSPAKRLPNGGSFFEPDSTTQNLGVAVRFLIP